VRLFGDRKSKLRATSTVLPVRPAGGTSASDSSGEVIMLDQEDRTSGQMGKRERKMPFTIRLTQILFGVVCLGVAVDLVLFLRTPSSVMIPVDDQAGLALTVGRSFLVLAAGIYSILSLQRRWAYSRYASVATLILLFVISLLTSPLIERWREALTLSGVEARGVVLGSCMFLAFVLILAVRLLMGSREREYLG